MKKLENIKYSKNKVYRHIAKNGSSLGNKLQANPLLFHYHLYRNISDAYQKEPNKLGFAFSVPSRVRNQFVCDFGQDTATLILAFEYLNDYPDAQKMLWHYFTGNGEEVEVNTERVMKEAARLKTRTFAKLAGEIKSGKKSGEFIMGQLDYGNENWRNAFGGIWINWTLRHPMIDLWITNVYKWTPGEARTTQCVHQAMVRAEKYGAKKFPFKGTKYVISVKELENLSQQISQPAASI